MKKQWKVIVGFLLVLLIVLFAVLNSQDVPVSFGFSSFKSPLIIVIIGSALIGALVVFLTSSANLFQQRKQIKQLEQQVKDFETDHDKKVDQAIADYKTDHEQEVATLTANYESMLKDKEAEINQLRNQETENKSEPLNYYD
ncbi:MULTISPECIES: LapA family protein [Enterococcus]|uniref:DUF1049 domain-containing protein n=1 Tax=Enterococcus alishanensis TaxID=1303817 RepID=A0ABS6TB91_9ENTE|nr:LapA family protein [Enterococcus alishanensis]MBV7390168.1 DUF1049 domain-containing protein [Enterococcus alishanensis]